MRCRLIGLALLMGAIYLVSAPTTTLGQKRPGGFDAGAIFDMMAKGRPGIPISEFRFMRKEIQDYATQNNITNGQLTREQYLAYAEQSKAKGQGGFKGGPGGFKGFPGGFQPPGDSKKDVAIIAVPGGAPGGAGAFNPVDSIKQWAESDFKRRDANLDNFLNTDEMPGALKDDLDKWDANKDGLIDLEEYRAYTLARLGVGRNPDNKTGSKAVTILTEEEDLDRRPVVFRANNLPKGLPKWFEELDTNKDGQVALYEWRQGKMPMDDFKLWDRNDDGFITIEEALRFSGTQLAGTDKTTSASPTLQSPGSNGSESKSGDGKGKRGFNFSWGKKNK